MQRDKYSKRKREPFSIKVQTVDGSIEWVPQRTNSTDACFNIKARSFSNIDEEGGREEICLEPGDRVLAMVGFMLDLIPGWEGQIRTKSDLALESGLSVLNSPGTIDNSYRDEIGIILINNGEQDITLNKGDEIACMIVTKIPHVKLWHVQEIHNPIKDIEDN